MKQYTRDEFAKSLLELCEGDPGSLAEYVIKINSGIETAQVIAEYRNAEVSPRSWGDRRYLALPRAQEPQKLIGDSQGTSRMYALEAVYEPPALDAESLLDLPAMLRELKIPRPAVAYVSAGYAVNGNSRKGWVIYRDQRLIEFVPDDDQHEDRLAELNVTKDMATGTIKLRSEVWDEITDEDNWPVSSRKFASHRAERFYGYTLESGQDEELGDSDWGWYALFKVDLVILEADTQGFVSVTVYEDEEALTAEWERLSAAWDEYNEEEDE